MEKSNTGPVRVIKSEADMEEVDNLEAEIVRKINQKELAVKRIKDSKGNLKFTKVFNKEGKLILFKEYKEPEIKATRAL